jgi:NitT/TauT family transport system substrate-binding protein
MKLRIAENFRALFYAPFYAIRALGLAAREGLEVDWLSSEVPGGAISEVKRGAIDAQWGGPMRVLKDHDRVPASAGTTSVAAASLVCFTEVVWRDPFYLVGRERSLQLKDVGAMRLGVVSEVPTPWYCLRADLEDAGVDTSKLQTIKNLTMAQQLEALAAGKLDAVQLFEPYASRALADGYAILYAAASRGPSAYTAFITSRDSAAKRRDEFAALTRATQATLDWLAAEGPAELARLTAPFFADVPQELLHSALERYHRAGLWAHTTTVSKTGFERLAYSLHDGGFIARRATYAECVHDFGHSR